MIPKLKLYPRRSFKWIRKIKPEIEYECHEYILRENENPVFLMSNAHAAAKKSNRKISCWKDNDGSVWVAYNRPDISV